ncbi:MAG: glycoside hydrolase family 88 protein [Sedimentisphaerales bacterium]|nr:glycoside hydrolase family 88 protein [Sedimentisphaerales bacterium]
MSRKLAYIGLLLIVLNFSQPAFSAVSLLGSWVTGTSHTKEAGSNRILVVIGHAEGSSGSNPVLSAVTYGGQTMTKVADKTQTWDATARAYVAVFILNEAGVAAASSSTISATWSGTSSNHLTSVFLGNADQANIIGDIAVNGVRALATIATSALATSDGDIVIAGVTCTGTGTYTPNNGFTEGAESPISNADGCGIYKSATGVPETSSVTHSTSTNHQAIVGFVVQAIPDANRASHPSPGNGISGVTVTTSLSWDEPAGYTPTSYDVYFGTSPAVRSNPRYTVYTASYTPPEYLAAETTYYWAVDSNDAGTVYAGDSWSFTTYVPIDGDLVANYVISLNLPGTTYYADLCAYYGVLVWSELTGNTAMRDSIIAKYPVNYYNGSQMPPKGDVDKNVYGIYPFEMYRQTGDANYLTAALYLADDEFANPRPDGLSAYTRFWIDDTYMIGSLQTQAYKSMGNIIYANRAVTQLLGYMGDVEDMQAANGLFYHTLSSLNHWGRGNGWAAAAMTEVLLAIPQDHPRRTELLGKYQAMMAGLVTYQGAGGMWYEVLNMGGDPRNWYESSCTGMFIFALATGVRQGWLPEQPYKKAAFDGWAGLANFVDSQGRALQVCTGTGASSGVQYYFDRPREIGNTHAEAGIIWAATAMAYLLNDTNAPPAAPTDLTATAGNEMVSLDWNDNSEADLDGYNVYRSLTSGSGYSKLNVALVADSNYIDSTAVNGTPYYYVVTALDVNGYESGYSNEATATPWFQTCAELQAGGYGLASDLNGDCYVNYEDLEVIANYWLSTCTEPSNCEGADFEPADGIVDLYDFSDFAIQWLECNDPEDSNCG